MPEAPEHDDLAQDGEPGADQEHEGHQQVPGQLPGEDDRHRVGRGPEQREDREGDDVAMGEVDETHDAEDQRDAERAERIEGAERERVEDDLQHVQWSS